MTRSDHIYDPHALEDTGAEGGSAVIERDLEASLRPARLDEFVGQARLLDNLRIAIAATKGRDEPLDHVLFSGPPGLGKTSLARVLATELGTRMVATSGPALEKPRDLVGILTQLQKGEVLFIDEVHRVPAQVEEYLYTAMEDFQIDFTIDQGPHARVVPLSLRPFTLVGATTREGLLTAPFRARFGISERLELYTPEELQRILLRSSGILGVELTEQAARFVAERSRGTPRIANRFLRRVRDLTQVRNLARAELATAREALERMGVDEHGLEELDRRVLRVLADAGGAPVGLKTIAAAVGEAEDTIEEVFEPQLLRLGCILKTPRGRCITPRGCAVLGLPAP
jgi:Holliday junction DNA helicase RuvB